MKMQVAEGGWLKWEGRQTRLLGRISGVKTCVMIEGNIGDDGKLKFKIAEERKHLVNCDLEMLSCSSVRAAADLNCWDWKGTVQDR